ncbi:MAG: CotH kinase family protein, partial [Firmicutes bacterium]|nr:CotH kinase family protein [Bacillota bacterium]
LYHNLDKLSLNNLIYDATLMKDYLAYTLMGKMGVASPLCSFVQVNVNGKPWGLYLAVEGVEDGFMQRNNMTTGELYKPDSLSFGGGRGNGADFDIDQFRVEDDEDGGATTENNSQWNTNDFGGSGGGQGGDAGGSGGGQAQTNGWNGNQAGGNWGGSEGGQAQTDGGNANQQNGGNWGGSDGGTAQPENTEPTQDTAPATQNEWGGSQGGQAGQDGDQESRGNRSNDGEDRDQGSWGGQGGDNGDGGFGGFGGGGGGFGFNFGMGSSDVKLQYSNDNPSSYSNIFNNAKTDVTEKDQARLIEALKTLNGVDGADPKDAVFADEVIRYFVVHDFLQNGDSYTGMMIHNYYLYEENGRLAIIPWDYNLAFGGMTGSSASSVVNAPIDNPVSDSTGSDRPLVYWILSDEEALAEYHDIYDQFVTEIIETGWLEEELTRVSAMILPYVEADENSFFNVNEFDAAMDAMHQYCALRGQSVRGQLDGTIPSTSAGQRADSSALVKTGSLDIKVMGSMNGNRGGGGFGGFGGRGGDSEDGENTTQDGGDGWQWENDGESGGGSGGGSAGGSAGNQSPNDGNNADVPAQNDGN